MENKQTLEESDMNMKCKECSPREIGGISNYYGCLSVKTVNGRHYWSIENWDGFEWEEIPSSLFKELIKFENSRNSNKS